jgi:glycolate oxidase FAD binding subunit
MSEAVVPRSFSEAARVLADAAAAGRPVRIVGGGTKLGWGGAVPAKALRLHTAHLSRVDIHADGRSATINAGTPLARAQGTLVRRGMILAADPQLGLERAAGATVGGVFATGDSGPLAHRYGPPARQLQGITVALSDGTIVRTGPRTGRPQDGLDLAWLHTGAFGTLGVILSVDVALIQLPGATASALGMAHSAEHLAAAARALAEAHPELQALDCAWHQGRGGLLAQVAGERAPAQAQDLATAMRAGGLEDVKVCRDDAGLWARQRAGQRSASRALLRVHHRPDQLAEVLRAADGGEATVVGRAALGLSYLTLDPTRVGTVRDTLPEGATGAALDIPPEARSAVAPWDLSDGPELTLMRELKRRFDPARACNPGVFVGGI